MRELTKDEIEQVSGGYALSISIDSDLAVASPSSGVFDSMARDHFVKALNY